MVAVHFVGAGSLMALVFAAFIFVRVRREPGGNPEMLHTSGTVQKGANAYLRRQYKGVGVFFAVVLVIPLVIALRGFLSLFASFVSLTSGLLLGPSGFIGTRIATMANCRITRGASRNLNRELRVALSAGSVMGFTAVGLDLPGLAIWYFILNMAFGALPDSQWIAQITADMLTPDTGAPNMALFARVGGSISTKAANMGADLMGKVGVGIPEDGLRNPAVIADNTGDNAGDVAGMGADLHESYVGSTVSTAALAMAAGHGGKGTAIPMMLAVLGVLASILGTFFVKTEKDASQKDLLKALRTEAYISATLVVAAVHTTTRILLPDHMGIYVTISSGLAASVLIGAVMEYYTSDTYNPTRKLAVSSQTGGATVITSGLSPDMLFTVAPVVIVGISVLISYYCSGGGADFNVGLYGVGVSAVGMLSTLSTTLTTDAYRPIADNAGGIIEVTHVPEEVRQRTDAPGSPGSIMAVTNKGFAIGSAALTALALIVPYIDRVKQIDPSLSMGLSITSSTVLIGLFIGDMLPFLFATLIMEAVGETTQSIMVEVCRQFREIKGLMEGKAEPDYGVCVDMCTISAQGLMVAPAMVAVIIPVVVGLLLGSEGTSGLLAGGAVTGFVLVVMMTNAGGAWDNAKKYVGSGQLGRKGSEKHKAAIMGDIMGDPFKDTSGPSISILVKLTSMISIVLAGLVVAVHLL